MVELMNHLRFVQRQVDFLAANESIGLQNGSICLQLLPRAEQVCSSVHHEHQLEAKIPRILARKFVDQDRHPLVDATCQLCVSASAEDRTCFSVRVDTSEILRRERKCACFIPEIGRAS